jgi:AraC-like DNA-binding protein
MYLREIRPSPVLANFVMLYRIIDFEFPNNDLIPAKAYTPRPEQCLQFFPTPTIIDYPDKGKSVHPKNALLIGQHTITNNRTVFKKFLSLQVVFQPGALYRLLGFSTFDITDESIEASDLFGFEIERVNDQLFHAKTHEQLIIITERWLMKVVNRCRKRVEPIDLVFQQMLDPKYPLDWYVSNAFLCHRQFDRKFIDRIGIGPKEYLRIVRFDQAYRMKNRFPEMSWFNIAITCGYFDYQHLSKDYKAFTSHTPATFFALESPERLLGTEEIY